MKERNESKMTKVLEMSNEVERDEGHFFGNFICFKLMEEWGYHLL